MAEGDRVEDLLRALAPQVLAVVARRHEDFAAAEDAVQEALVAAAAQWPVEGRPENPAGWLVRVARRRLVDRHRSDGARRTRERLAASIAVPTPDAAPSSDDSLDLLFLCCHPALAPSAAIPLTLRAVGGLTTREIATAFVVPEPTMAQRISRAKASIKAAGARFAPPRPEERSARLALVLHVLYLVFNEGYAASAGAEVARADLSAEAIRLARLLHAAAPDEPEAGALLALMLLDEARRPARTGPGGELVTLADQDRSRWDRAMIDEGIAVLEAAVRLGTLGEYQLQAAIAATHDRAPTYAATEWAEVDGLYAVLEKLAGNPMVTLNRAVATGMAVGPAAGLERLATVAGALGDHHRFHAVRGHLLEQGGDAAAAAEAYRQAAARATNQRERDHLATRAARLRC